MSFGFFVNGKEQKNWTSAAFFRSIDELCGKFTFVTSFLPNAPILRNDLIELYVDGKLKLTGYQDSLSGNRTVSSKIRTIMGRDITQDLVDSSVPIDALDLEGGTLKTLAEEIIKGLGMDIKVIEDLDAPLAPFETFYDQDGGGEGEEDIESSPIDQTAFDYLMSFARKRQVYLITSPSGNLVIFRANDRSKIAVPLNVKNMMKNQLVAEASFKKDFAAGFAKITCASQETLQYSLQEEDAANQVATVTIPGIRPSRQRAIVAEEAMDVDECRARAVEEANILKMKSEEYSCTVTGTNAPDGTQWEIGQQIEIIDEEFGASGIFLLKSYTMSLDLERGTQTELVFTRPSSYQQYTEVPPHIERKSKFDPEQITADGPPIYDPAEFNF